MNGNLAYQEDQREELIGGKVVAMSPRPAFNHNQVASNIFWIFRSYLHGRNCTPIADGTDLYLDEENQFIPDFMVVCDRDKIQPDGVHGAPDLVVEVLSPSTTKNDRLHKKEAYEKCGVREYWIVDPANKTVEQHLLQSGKLVLSSVYSDYPDYVLAKMSEEERAAVATHFQCSLYDDFDIPIGEIFSGLLPQT